MSGITITADSGTQFEAGAAEYNSIDRLSDDSFVVAYRDGNDYNYGKVNVGSRTGTSITINEANAVTFNSDDTDLIMVKMMSSTLIVISYRDVNSGLGYVVCGTISGLTVTLGTPVSDGNAQITSVSVAVLDGTNFVFSRYYTTGWHFVCSVSGTTITMGAYQQGQGGSRGKTLGLDGTNFISVYSNTNFLCQICTVNIGAKTISFGTQSGMIHSGDIYDGYWAFVDKFDSTHVIVGNTSNQNYPSDLIITALAINLTTKVVTVGTTIYASNSNEDNKSQFSLIAINAYSFLLAYYTTTGTQAEVRSGTLTGDTTIAWDAQGAQIFDNGTSSYTALCRLTDDYFILGYKSG